MINKVSMCTAIAVGAISSAALAGGSYSEDFESYAPGPLAGQGGWEGWFLDPGAAGFVISTAQAHAGAQSVAVTGNDDAVREFTGFGPTGIYAYDTYTYLPADMTDSTFFILLNTYTTDGSDMNWSSQWNMDAGAGFISMDSGDSALISLGEWVRMRTVINFGANTQTLIYGDTVVGTQSWTEGASGAGILALAAVDLWANTTSSLIHYDDMNIDIIPATGACCFADGTCTPDSSSADCLTAGGIFQGIGTECGADTCPIKSADGWVVTAPFDWSGDTTTESDDCALSPSPDSRFVVTIPWDAPWTFSLCGSIFDTKMALGAAPCGDELATGDDECGAQSEFTVALTAGTYYLTVEGFGGTDVGTFFLNVDGPCIGPVTVPGGALVEPEPCGDDVNPGCNGGGVLGVDFTPVACGDTYHGTAWFDGATRDTDWYEFHIDAETDVTWSGTSEFPMYFAIVNYLAGFEGSGDCADGAGTITVSPTLPCQDQGGSVSRTLTVPKGADEGIYWFWMGSDFTTASLCTDGYSEYVATLTCGGAEPCVGDITGPTAGVPDGTVDTLDLLALLGGWGPNPGHPGDITGPTAGVPDGVVDTLDLLALLGNWGDCE
jgi:hypothetical protein